MIKFNSQRYHDSFTPHFISTPQLFIGFGYVIYSSSITPVFILCFSWDHRWPECFKGSLAYSLELSRWIGLITGCICWLCTQCLFRIWWLSSKSPVYDFGNPTTSSAIDRWVYLCYLSIGWCPSFLYMSCPCVIGRLVGIPLLLVGWLVCLISLRAVSLCYWLVDVPLLLLSQLVGVPHFTACHVPL
jgi:hypothetical protein